MVTLTLIGEEPFIILDSKKLVFDGCSAQNSTSSSSTRVGKSISEFKEDIVRNKDNIGLDDKNKLQQLISSDEMVLVNPENLEEVQLAKIVLLRREYGTFSRSELEAMVDNLKDSIQKCQLTMSLTMKHINESINATSDKISLKEFQINELETYIKDKLKP